MLKKSFALCGLLLIICVFSVSAQKSACSCNDIIDLMNRYNEAQAAINEYKNQIKGIEAKEKADGKPLMFSQDIYKTVTQPRIQSAINQVTNPNAKSGSAETRADCKTEFKDNPTTCVRDLLDTHEDIHRKACAKAKSWNPFEDDWLKKQRLADVLREEIEAYTAESNKILDVLQTVNNSCKPKDWFGTIQTVRSLKNSNETILETGDWLIPLDNSDLYPPKDAIEASIRQTNAELSKQGFYAKNLPAFVTAYIEREKTGKGEPPTCCGSTSGEPSNIDVIERETGGRETVKGTVSLAIIFNKLNQLDFSHDQDIKGIKQEKRKVHSSPCSVEKDRETESQINLQLAVNRLELKNSLPITNDGKFEVLKGSETIKSGNETFTYTWKLRRLK